MIENKINKSLDVFIAYSREDEQYRTLLEKHLIGLERHGLINPWHDGKIEAGKEWEVEIETKLNQADIILLLISVDFLSSDYCYNIEMLKALERHKNGDVMVIPIIVRPCHWEDSPFSKLQVLPNKGKAISTWGIDLDSPLNEVSKNLHDLIKKIKKEKELYYQKLSSEIKELEKRKSSIEEEVNLLTTNKQMQIENLSKILEVRVNLETDYLNVLKSSIEEKIADIKITSENFENIISGWASQLKKSLEIIKTENTKIKNIENEQKAYIKKLQSRLDDLQINIAKVNEIKKTDLSETDTLISKDLPVKSIKTANSAFPLDSPSLRATSAMLKWFVEIDKK